tara:strand:- start:862 stop:1116 length:255 start_codon:yes stop_codon:yes gene_type:complete
MGGRNEVVKTVHGLFGRLDKPGKLFFKKSVVSGFEAEGIEWSEGNSPMDDHLGSIAGPGYRPERGSQEPRRVEDRLPASHLFER